METSTTVKGMTTGNEICVPSYQRAYSWDTELKDKDITKQVNTFLSDLENHLKSNTNSPYYFGHFLFEENGNHKYGIIDGQQRLTTIVIFLSALFDRLKQIRPLNENEKEIYEDMVKRNSTYRFATVDYDNRLFIDYVIDRTKKNTNGLETESAKRIVNAFDFFCNRLKKNDEQYLLDLLDIVQNAACTTHSIKDKSEAIQMFIFQNNRGKRPSNLEIIKAQFMFAVYLHGGEGTAALTQEIEDRFKKIYMHISKIEYNIDEDDVLIYTLRVYFNSLSEGNALDKINGKLSEKEPLTFIKDFTRSLEASFDYLDSFFTEAKNVGGSFAIHSLVMLGGIALAFPFIIKAYLYGLSEKDRDRLYTALESIVVRHRLIGTRADMVTLLNDVYQDFTQETPNITPIVERITWLKKTKDWWWSYWNNDNLYDALYGWIDHTTAKFLLWKYENHLIAEGNAGYNPVRYNAIKDPELEHIAPQTPPENGSIVSGYDKYDEKFKNEYIDCIGNYLLISKSHNCAIGNKPFSEKLKSYTQLAQQREINGFAGSEQRWDKNAIDERHEKIVAFITETL